MSRKLQRYLAAVIADAHQRLTQPPGNSLIECVYRANLAEKGQEGADAHLREWCRSIYLRRRFEGRTIDLRRFRLGRRWAGEKPLESCPKCGRPGIVWREPGYLHVTYHVVSPAGTGIAIHVSCQF